MSDVARIAKPLERELVEQIAMDIGKEVVAYVKRVYPEAVAASPSTFPLSLRNCVYNEIIAAIAHNDADEIAARLERRKRERRHLAALVRRTRETPVGGPLAPLSEDVADD